MDSVIVSGCNLDDIAARLYCCRSLLDVVRSDMEGNDKDHEEALFGVSSFLDSICRDFQAEIDSAEDYVKTSAAQHGQKKAVAK